ncbi:myelin expression factor 2 [Adelges cooleyi]|uniref:myelin expression factor 2 n=1 Tax=Adelges cooleyi TaxID=133065 RepID=UPI00217F9F35|nr:myelin expression factor 2 [Adelges cooleyi]XP_050429956.1 myelin expression factor 2 [Adelges cooleyi]XP_050429957.1 myelin expression factor 2 [Adelges cooleyi]
MMRLGDRNRDRSRSPLRSRKSGCKKVFVSNIPYEFKWKELKELFRKEVGDVSFVVVYTDEKDKSRGCGTVEFDRADSAQKAIDKMHRFDINGRKLVVKEDDIERDKSGRPLPNGPRSGVGGGGGGGGTSGDSRVNNRMLSAPDDFQWDNTYGLSPQFLESLNIRGPLINRIFVANLDFKVDEKKLKEIFKLAGRVLEVEIFSDKEGKSKGYGIVEYNHPVEAVQAISMFNNQFLYDRPMSIRLDRTDKDPLARLPEGLKSIGMGLGAGGTPLHDVERNLPSNNNSPVQPQSINTPVNTSALAMLSGLSADRLGIETQNRRSFGGVNGLGSLSANDLGIGTGSLGTPFGPALNTSGTGPLNSSSLHQSALGGRDYDSLSVSLGVRGSGGGGGSYGADFRSGLGGGDIGMGPKKSDTIMVKNLPPNTTWQNLKDYFRDCGDIKFAEVGSKGFGIIRFASEWDAERAITLKHLSRFDGHIIEVIYF